MKAGRIGSACLGLAIAVVAGLVVRHAAIALPFPYPIEYPEGVTVHWTQQAAAGASLYPAVDPIAPLHNPYPPLFYRTASLLQLRLANPFLAARLMALAGLLLCGGGIAWLLRRSGAWYSLLGALLFVLSTTTLRYGTTARVDLPALGLALTSLAALVLAGRAWQTGLAGFLAGCALLTKPTLAAAAGAGLLVSGGRGWRPMASWAAGFALALGAGSLLFGSSAADVVNHLWTLNRLPWSLAGLGTLAGQTLARHPILAAGLVLFLAGAARQRDAVWWYAVFAIPGALLAGKVGADENYFLELIAVACVGTLRVARDLADARRDAGVALAVTLLAAAQVVMYLPVEPAPVFTRTYEQELAVNSTRFTPSQAESEAGALVATELRHAGSVLSQSPGLMVAAGRPPTWDAYQFTQLARAGAWDDRQLAARVAGGEFDLLLMLSDRAVATNYFPARVLSAVDDRYMLHRDLGPWRLMKPK